MELKAKPKAKRGRPVKNLNPEKAFEWFDELDYQRAVQDRKLWDEEYKRCQVITDTDFKTIQEFEADLRAKHPELEKLEIQQLYILDGLDRNLIQGVYRDLSNVSKPSLDKDDYTIKVPAEKANEYSQYLSICQAFNNIREAGNNQINIALIPQITGNRIVLDSRSMKLVPNVYRFTKCYK